MQRHAAVAAEVECPGSSRIEMRWVQASGVVLFAASCGPGSSSVVTPVPAGEPESRTATAEPEPAPKGPEAAEPSTARYFVEGKPVRRDTFERVVSSTSEVPGTWYCDEMSDGGETGWQATGKDGTVYRVRHTTDAEGSTRAISSQPSTR